MIESIETNLVRLEIIFFQVRSGVIILGILSLHVMTVELASHVESLRQNKFLLRDPWVI